MPHYMMDKFYRDASRPDGVRKESCRIAASSDSEAIREAKMVAIAETPDHFRLRIVARKGDTIIYRSTDA
jgi:hypothetical protein